MKLRIRISLPNERERVLYELFSYSVVASSIALLMLRTPFYDWIWGFERSRVVYAFMLLAAAVLAVLIYFRLALGSFLNSRSLSKDAR